MPSSQLPWVLDSQVPSHPPGALRLVERAEHVQPNCFSLAVISRFNTISRHRTRIQKVKETTPCSPAPPGLASSCPGSQPLPSPIPRSSQQSGPQAGVSAHCLFTPHAANCHFPSMTDVTAIQYVRARTKAFSRSTKPSGMQTGLTSIEATCRGHFFATPPSMHTHVHTHIHTHTHNLF